MQYSLRRLIYSQDFSRQRVVENENDSFCLSGFCEAVLFFLVFTASKESAFVYAISSAGVVHEVTKACSRGELIGCTCDTKRKGRSHKGFEWGGCSDNIGYGLRFAKLFVDSREQERDARAKMNLHNNFVGRRVSIKHPYVNFPGFAKSHHFYR